MRFTMIALTVAIFAAMPAAAQTSIPEEHPYGLDPYKPSDAALLRTWGSTLVAQTPLLELNHLDPYKPSQAALLRQLGGGIPIWSHLSWYPTAPPPAPLMLPAMSATSAANQAGATQKPVVVILVPPANGSAAPRVSPDRPREALPVPRQQPRLPGTVPGGPMKVLLTPEQAVQVLTGSTVNRQDDQPAEP